MQADHSRFRSVLEAFDGKEVSPLKLAISSLKFGSESVDALLSFIENEEEKLQVGASWILLNHPETCRWIGEEQKNRILDILSWDTPWQVSLHLLRLYPSLPLSKADCLEYFPVLERMLEHKRPFVRAWAYNALYLVAESEASVRDAVAEKLSDGLRNEKGSVSARIRNATRKSRWFKYTGLD